MDYICPTCGKHLPRELSHIIPHTEEHIIDAIKENHPEWVKEGGVCKKCYEHYKKQMNKEK